MARESARTVSQGQDTIDILARHTAKTTFEDLSPRVVELVKLFTLDTFGTMIGGSSQPGAREMVDLVKDWGGTPEGTLAVYGGRVPAPWAAMVNSVMAHALDLDDHHDGARVHCCCSQLPVALALAERAGKSGREVITAAALGMDIACRLGAAVRGGVGWVRSGTCNIFGAAANAAKLLELDERGIRHAMGISLSQAAGSFQAVIDGAMVKRMQPGLVSADAVVAAFMAARGVTGPVGVIDGKYGFLELYRRGQIFPERLTDGLGEFYEIERLGAKIYCGGRPTHGAIEATIDIVTREDLRPHEIAKITVYLPPSSFEFVGRPFVVGESPQASAQFSAAYAVAAAATRRDYFIEDIQEAVIMDPDILDLAQRRTEVVADEMADDSSPSGQASVQIEMMDGRKFRRQVVYVKGHPKNFPSREEFVAKFRKVVPWSAVPLPPANIERLIEAIDRLETLEDASIMMRLAQPALERLQ